MKMRKQAMAIWESTLSNTKAVRYLIFPIKGILKHNLTLEKR
jgi:hypothetical protein